jgi:RimJ/RimL family protein N-acetyltransferase
MKIILETPRLVLRELTRNDLDFLITMLGDDEVMRFYPHHYARPDAEAWLKRQLDRYQRDGHGGWLVQDRQTGELIGQVGLILQMIEGEWIPEIGYLIHRPYWRQGFASEAACAVRDWAFTRQQMPFVVSLIRPINVPSQGVARKLGMRPVQLLLHSGLEHVLWRVDHPAGT